MHNVRMSAHGEQDVPLCLHLLQNVLLLNLWDKPDQNREECERAGTVHVRTN